MNITIVPLKRVLGRTSLALVLSGLLLLLIGLLLRPAEAAQAESLIQPEAKAAPTAALRYVAVEGTDAVNDCSVSTNPCATVQHAVDVAEPDDEIRVAAGTYTGVQVRQGITQVVYISQSVTIRGGYTTTNWVTSDPETNMTILDAQGQGRVIVILYVQATLEDLRITGGDPQSFADLGGITGKVGGGLYIAAVTTISGCQIYSNAATHYGGGLAAYSSAITVTHSRIFSNSLSPVSSLGGGIFAQEGVLVVDNNTVYGNSANGGGGIFLSFGSLGGRLSRNQIYNNRAFWSGGGVALAAMNDTGVLISSNVFSQNIAETDGGGMLWGLGPALVTDNFFISNTASGQGGGAYVYGGADTLMRNIFISNTSSLGGGGVAISFGPATLIENQFMHNHANLGGGIRAQDFGTLTMTANVVMSNTAIMGGGLDLYDETGKVILARNVLAGNNATEGNGSSGIAISAIQSGVLINNAFVNHPGYALTISRGRVTLTHNTIISNMAGISLENYGYESQLTLINTILANNVVALEAGAGTTATLDGVLWFDNVANTSGSGYITVGQQITANPLLAADGYHLLAGSPAIDAGVLSGITDDIDGEPRPSGPAVDIGADEWLYPTSVDLLVTQQVSPEVVYPTQGVTYAIAYRNIGVGITATGVVISAEIPAGLTDLSIVSSGAVLTAMPGMTYTWQVADLSSGTGGLITITAVVMPGLAPQVLTSTVSITASQTDSNLANNTANAVLTIGNRAPLASAGSDQSALVSSAITLDGSASADPDGHLPLTYEWQQVDGVPIMLSSNAVSRPTFIAPSAPSILRFSLIVTDSLGLQSTEMASAVVTVTDRPVTNLVAVNDSPTTLGRSTMFVAWAEGSNIVYTWNFGDGATAANQTVVHTYELSGTYTAIVTATNGSGSVTATTPVTITNLSPLANAGPDRIAAINSVVTLDGSGSTDPDGHLPLSYEWWQVSGSPVVLSSGTISRPVFTAPNAPAVLAFSLIVTDNRGLRSPLMDTVVITASDRPITAMWVLNSSPTTLGQATWFTATTDGSNVAYTWNFGDGTQALGNPISHTYSAQSFYTAIVTATNGVSLLTAALPVTITNLAPVAVAGSDQDVIVNSTVSLDGSGSYDQDGHVPLAYQWTQTGGPAVLLNSAVISRPIFTAPAIPSVLTFTLRVTDAHGLAGAADATVMQVNDQAITGLQAHNNGPIKVGHSVNFTATLAAGSNVLYQWNFGDGVISNPTTLLTATHVYTRYGSFTATVTATNQSGIEVGTTLVVIQPYSVYIPLLRKDS